MILPNFFPWQYPEGCPFRREVGVVLQVQNSSRACKNCSVITPIQKDSRVSFTDRSATPSRNPSPRQLDHSAEILPCVESLQQPSTPTKDVVRGDHSGEVSDSDSDSESD